MNNSSISKINPNSAGIDIGTEYIFIGVENKTVVSFPGKKSNLVEIKETLIF